MTEAHDVLASLSEFASAMTGDSVLLKTPAGPVSLSRADILTAVEELQGHRELTTEATGGDEHGRAVIDALEVYIAELENPEGEPTLWAGDVASRLGVILSGEPEGYDEGMVAAVLQTLQAIAPTAGREHAETLLDSIEAYLSRAQHEPRHAAPTLEDPAPVAPLLPTPTPNRAMREVDPVEYLGAKRDGAGRIDMGGL